MKQASYTDEAGRQISVWLPDTAPESHGPMGVRIGPPDLSPLGLPLETEVRLHNELHARGLLTASQAAIGLDQIRAALMAALKVDALAIAALYD